MSTSDFTFKVEKICDKETVVDELTLQLQWPTGCFENMSIEQQRQYFLGILYQLLWENIEYKNRFPIWARVRMILLEEKPRKLQ